MILEEVINKYDLDYKIIVYDKERKLQYYEIYNDETLKREILSKEENDKIVSIKLK